MRWQRSATAMQLMHSLDIVIGSESVCYIGHATGVYQAAAPPCTDDWCADVFPPQLQTCLFWLLGVA